MADSILDRLVHNATASSERRVAAQAMRRQTVTR
jgi:hypothetical protein